MSEESLKDLVTGLRNELARARDLDESTRDGLHELAREVEAALEGRTAEPSEAASTLGVRLADRVRELEASHPTISTTLGNMIDTLAFYGL